MFKYRSIVTGIGFIGLVFFFGTAQAELKRSGDFNFVDTETGLEWRTSLVPNEFDDGYDQAIARLGANTTYRLPTAGEMDDLIGKVFPDFVGDWADGRCARELDGAGGYPEQKAEAEKFFELFGDTSPDNGLIRALYEDAGGSLRQLRVELNPWGSLTAFTCLTGSLANYESFRTAPIYERHTVTLVVRPMVDRKAPSITLFRELSPTEVGFYPQSLLQGYDPGPYYEDQLRFGGTWDDTGWRSQPSFPDYTGTSYWAEFKLATNPSPYGELKVAPWIRINSLEYTGACNNGDADIGDGWCRRTFAGAQYQYTGGPVDLSGTFVANQGSVDNIEMDQIWNNMDVDYSPTDPDNEIRPKSPNWSMWFTVQTTSIAAGDEFDFNAADIDPATVRAGRGGAQPIQYQLTDFDNDGDFDMTFVFKIGDTSVHCLDKDMALAGRTFSGAPMAGIDVIAPTHCEDIVDIDVDPFNSVNTIRPNDNYNVTVALLGMSAVSGDAVNLYPGNEYNGDGVVASSLRLGAAETPAVGMPVITDIDGDSLDDMLLSFNVYDAGIACGDTELKMTGSKNSGLPIEGVDTIVTEDCETAACHP